MAERSRDPAGGERPTWNQDSRATRQDEALPRGKKAKGKLPPPVGGAQQGGASAEL